MRAHRPILTLLAASALLLASTGCEPNGQANVGGGGDPTGEKSTGVEKGSGSGGSPSGTPTSTTSSASQIQSDAGLHFCDPTNPDPGCLDRQALQTALTWARSQVDTCAMAGAPNGDGHIAIVLESSGAPSSETLDAPPFANSTIAPCLQNVFSAIRVPPFSGGPMSMGASFHVDAVGGFEGGVPIP